MVTKGDEENRFLLCNVTNRAAGSIRARHNDIEEVSEATYIEIHGFMGIRQK
jgi:hypothetical protein